jgi:Asp-tRNA(Asn)/Glu-tRNA(Gln) amidotransferase A subunit family amidase
MKHLTVMVDEADTPADLTAYEARAAIEAGTLTAEALVRACLLRIEQREGLIGAWEYLDADLVIKQAKHADAAPNRGLLHGIPIGIKDVIDTADMPTRYGSHIYEQHYPAWDAACVSLCRAAGGIILGKTVTTEFALTTPGKTRNPHNVEHTPGGSSSGSAAAVADRMVPLAVGTQTGGSTIRPASFCGIVGYKPTFGFISRSGLKAVAESLDTIGIFARDVRDAALLAAVMAGRHILAAVTPSAPPRIAIWRTFEWKHASQETVQAVEDAAMKLACAGAKLTEAQMPQCCAELADSQREIEYFELGRAFSFEYENHREQLSAKLRSRIECGLQCAGALYDRKLKTAAECRRNIDIIFNNCDVLLAPSAVGEAPVGLQSTGDSVFNKTWTLLGLPCLNIPSHFGPKGLPVGIQLIGRAQHDSELLAHAAWVEKALR